jgi:hypothetical protein
VGLQVKAQIEGHALWVSSATALSGLGAQHRFDLVEKDKGLVLALRELPEARLKLARWETFTRAPSPSTMVH